MSRLAVFAAAIIVALLYALALPIAALIWLGGWSMDTIDRVWERCK